MQTPPAGSTASPLADAYGKHPTKVRFWILFGLACAATIAYLSRVCLATANTTIQREFGFNDVMMGQILAAFSVGYFWFQVPGGSLGNRFGCRKVLPLICVWWSLCAGWTGLAATAASFWWSRMISGIAQAGLVPVSAKGVLDWFPQRQRGVASSMMATAMSLGAVIASGLTAQLMPVLGWRGVFWLYAGIGILWSILFYIGFRNRPEEHPRVNAVELRDIRGEDASRAVDSPEPVSGSGGAAPGTAGRAAPAAAPPVVPGLKEPGGSLVTAMLSSSSMWLICIQAFFRAFGAAFFITWFPAYLEQARGVNVKAAGFLAMAPLTGTVLGNLAGGVIVDRLLTLTGSKRISRSGTSMVALAACAILILSASWIPDAGVCVALLAMGSFFGGVGSPATWACTMDISGKHTSIVFAWMNMTGNIGAMVCPLIVGYQIDWIKRTGGDWNTVLYLFVGIYVLGALCWVFLNPNRSAVSRARA